MKSKVGLVFLMVEEKRDRSAFKDKLAIIKRNLSVGHNIVVMGFLERESKYNLTISAP
jgi:hypothetical protein